jgi:hypothetical protein
VHASFPLLIHPNKELLPSDIVCAKETRDLVIECCVGEHLLSLASLKTSILTHSPEFIHLISSEANEICEQESKKTIAPEHIIAALKVRPPHGPCNHQPLPSSTQRLGFDAFTHEVEDVLKDHKQQQKVRIGSLYTSFLT